MVRLGSGVMNRVGVMSATGLVMIFSFLFVASAWVSSGAAAVEDIVNTNVLPMLGISATSEVAISIQASADAASTFGTDYTVLRVATNNDLGYTLQMSDTDGDNVMNRSQAIPGGAVPKINSVTSDTPGSALVNQWGYNFVVTSSSLNGGAPVLTSNTLNTAASTFHAIPTTATTIRDTSQTFLDATTKASLDIIQVNYGVGITPRLPTGDYLASITYTAVTNYVPADFYSITYMDEMTHAICANTTTPAAFVNGVVNADVPETTLVDRRDGQSYVVRKLADGNCWMSQNLAISKESIAEHDPNNTDGTLVASLTDTTGDTVAMKMPTSYQTGAAAIAGGWTTTNPNTAGVFLGVDANGNKQYIENGYNAYNYSVDGQHNANGLSGSSGELNGGVTKTSGAEVYSIGNYYSWYVASLGVDSSVTSGDAPSSICPKNWTLPSNGTTIGGQDNTFLYDSKVDALTTGFDSANKDSYSYANLMKVYGMAVDDDWSALGVYYSNHYNSAARLVAAPLSFPRSGCWDFTTSGVRDRGMLGHWWGATISNSTYVYYFHQHYERIIPQLEDYRSYGIAVRCVAR